MHRSIPWINLNQQIKIILDTIKGIIGERPLVEVNQAI